MNRFALWLTFALVVLPTTLASLVGSIFGLGWVLDSVGSSDYPMHDRHLVGTVFALALLIAGWFGIVTLWRLFVSLIRGLRPIRRPAVWAGLLAGSAASICLIFIVNGGAVSLLFGWPLVAVLHLGNEFSKTYPLEFRDRGTSGGP